MPEPGPVVVHDRKVRAPPQSQPAAPPDNVILLPAATFNTLAAPVKKIDSSAL